MILVSITDGSFPVPSCSVITMGELDELVINLSKEEAAKQHLTGYLKRGMWIAGENIKPDLKVCAQLLFHVSFLELLTFF